MSIGRGELTDWLKALRDFVDLYNLPTFYMSPPLPRKINGDEEKAGQRGKEKREVDG